jgi:hypothetical protein
MIFIISLIETLNFRITGLKRQELGIMIIILMGITNYYFNGIKMNYSSINLEKGMGMMIN